MKNIVISMQNTLLSEAIARSFTETGEFRIEQILPGKTDDTGNPTPNKTLKRLFSCTDLSIVMKYL